MNDTEQPKTIIVRIIGLSSGYPTAFDGQWLVEYDPTRAGTSPDGLPMTAHVVTTTDRSAARRFADAAAAHAEWTRVSGYARPDGRPDRPLTAFTIELENAE